ncbi:unnamed protein product [Fraxinus pennsylvanica]|uniref:Uncharacterized protein n=1 Tax=Fraxinus pennsylvanica TaxID=56036 RepID=A0AAD1ZWC7_9LAMI|nr:unnamed protein product [Fraxinus pennsylvanica]
MNMSTLKESIPESVENNDRMRELKEFEETKSGVKGLVDSGIVKIPKMFIRPDDELAGESNHGRTNIQIINDLKQASKDCGFFQVLNHGIPPSVLDDMLEGIRRFHEQDAEIKKEFYSRDLLKKVKYASNIDLYRSSSANWRDTLTISLLVSDRVEPDELPAVCRSSTMEYIDQVTKLGELLFKLLAEALGLKREHLVEMGCAKGRIFVCHYYPACPEPELTLGTSKHTDPCFLTVLLQDQIGGLQVLNNNQWINVQPLAGSLVVNIGDLFQIISNDEFKSAEHRVVANQVGPRISTACFFTAPPKMYGPIEEMRTEENPPIYDKFTEAVVENVRSSYSVPGGIVMREFLCVDYLMEGSLRFSELCSLLEPNRPVKTDKLAIIGDAIRVLNELKSESQECKEVNEKLLEEIKTLKVEKNELREEKLVLKSDKERIEQQLKATTVSPSGFVPAHPPVYQSGVNKIAMFPGYSFVPMWQYHPSSTNDTSRDHENIGRAA